MIRNLIKYHSFTKYDHKKVNNVFKLLKELKTNDRYSEIEAYNLVYKDLKKSKYSDPETLRRELIHYDLANQNGYVFLQIGESGKLALEENNLFKYYKPLKREFSYDDFFKTTIGQFIFLAIIAITGTIVGGFILIKFIN